MGCGCSKKREALKAAQQAKTQANAQDQKQK